MTETTAAHDEPKDRVVADFNAMADTYDTLRFVQIASRRLVDLVSLPAGAQVLDVATGTGWTALAAAQRAQFQAEHLAEVAALATDQGIGVDVAINVARGWKRAAEEQCPLRAAPRVGRAPWREIVRLFLTLGALSPGGPGLIGVLQTEVQEKRGWLSQARFVEGVALVNMLPGPSGAQLSIFLGYIRAGWWGGLLAGCCFLLPAFVIMLTLTLLYTHYGALPGLRGVFRGLNPVVVGIFAVAVYRLSTAGITDVTQGVLALAGALILGLTPLGIVPILLLAGALGVVRYGSRPWGLVATTVVAALQGIVLWSPPWLHLPVLSGWTASPGASPYPPGLGQIGLFFVKVGLFTFGGGLVLLAFLQEQVVQHLQWLTPQAFLDGLALGRLTPGPIPMLAAFIGYHAAGLWGAVVAGVAIFVPSFVLLLSLLPMLEHLERMAWLNAARQGMNPAIIGMIAVALLKLLPTAVTGLFPGVLALATVGAMVGWRVGPVPLMAVGAAIGAIGVLWGAG